MSYGIEDESRGQSHLDTEIRTSRPLDLTDNGVRQSHFRAISESPIRQLLSEATRNHEESILIMLNLIKNIICCNY